MSYVLATTENKVRWYSFEFGTQTKPGNFILLPQLDLNEVPLFGDKETAKRAAQALGLKTWRYVQI